MISVLAKPVDQIGPDDIQELIDSEVREGEQIEFKENLSTRGRSADTWVTGGDLGIRAKNEILREAVAFANAYGGALVLGIVESKTRPPVAADISPIPRCADLADSLKHVFRDRVEPQIPRIKIFEVPINGDDGVVIIRTGRSRMAPHRVTETLKCPTRRADRCEEMTMREIQDLTINTSRGLERLDRRLAQRSERFHQEFKCLSDPDNAFGIRMTAMPVADEIRLDRVFDRYSLVPRLNQQWRTVVDGEGNPLDQSPAIVPVIWRPMVRAARADSSLETSGAKHDLNLYMEIHCDGLVEVGYVSVPRSLHSNDNECIYLSLSQPMDMLANLIVQSDCMRNQSGTPTIEYAIEIEVLAMRQVVLMARTYAVSPLGSVDAGSKVFPKYSLGSPDEAPSLLGLFRRDFWNLLGHDPDDLEYELAIRDWPG